MLLLPIKKNEIGKFLSVSLIMFSILFIYTMTRDLKIIYIQKFATGGGTELIPVIKLFCVFPSIFLFIVLFEFLIDKFKHQKTFYIFVSGFSIFYLIFGIFLFPNHDLYHMNYEQVLFWQSKLPNFLHYVIPCIGNWSFVLFYILSEVWGSLILPALFWQFVHKITKKDEVKRFFGLYGLVGNLGVILSGYILKFVVNTFIDLHEFKIQSLILMLTCVIFCILSIFFYFLSNKKFSSDIISEEPASKEKLGFFKGLKILSKSKYMLLISAILFGYGITEDFIELTWQNYLRNNLSVTDFSSTMGNLSILIGILTIFFSIISPIMISRLSWKFLAMITPIVMGILGFLFFICYITETFLSINDLFGISVVSLIINCGLIAIAASRGVKYAIFDSTRNMAYLPLDSESRTKGQVTVESLGGRSGKSGSSIVSYTLTNLIYSGTKISKHLLIILFIFTVSIAMWIKSVFSLDRMYKEQVEIEK